MKPILARRLLNIKSYQSRTHAGILNGGGGGELVNYGLDHVCLKISFVLLFLFLFCSSFASFCRPGGGGGGLGPSSPLRGTESSGIIIGQIGGPSSKQKLLTFHDISIPLSRQIWNRNTFNSYVMVLTEGNDINNHWTSSVI